MNDSVKVSLRDRVAYVQLDREKKHNAVNREMFDALTEIGTTLADNRSLRAVVLSGAGRNFCAGIDITTFGEDSLGPSVMAPSSGSPANLLQNAAYVWRQMPVPVIAALDGVVFGAGLQIALGADLRLASPGTRLSIMEVKWGLVPDMALSTTLPALVPYDKAVELTWTGRIVDAEEALRIGLVSGLEEDPAASARELARQIASQSPDAIRAAKKLLRSSYADRDSALLRLEAELQQRVMAAPNHSEAVAANREERDASFGDSAI